jgi:hypothetical protein
MSEAMAHDAQQAGFLLYLLHLCVVISLITALILACSTVSEYLAVLWGITEHPLL